MSEKKNCMFQFATPHKIYKDTLLMTFKQAKDLWLEHNEKFIDLHKKGLEPEMCIWINCKDDDNYHTCIAHADCDSIVKNGGIYNLINLESELKESPND